MRTLDVDTSYFTYEKLAKEYILYMKSIQATGPYNVLGWSFGGALAFEIIRQLTIKGDTIGNVVLIDSFFNYKKVATIIGTESTEKDNMHYRYTPSIYPPDVSRTNIILFKASQVDDDASYMQPAVAFLSNKQMDTLYKIYNHYAKHTRANYLDDIIKPHEFTLIPMQHSHNSWIKDESVIDTIVDYLVK